MQDKLTSNSDEIQKSLSFSHSLKQTPIFIHFQDGTSFQGHVNKSADDPLLKDGIWAQSAFTTAMSGYQETATDPSFLGQHIIFTTAHVGNYPSSKQVNQSDKVHAKSLIARNFSYNDFLDNCDVPLVTIPDTRSLTLYLSSKSKDHNSVISTNATAPSKKEFENIQLTCSNLEQVSKKEIEVINPGKKPIVIINYGIKNSITQKLKELDYPLVSVCHTTTKKEILKLDPCMVFLSNGPGDPRDYKSEISVVKELLNEHIPIRGICLGHQLLGLALGHKVIKLPFGQRGTNHPVFDHKTSDLLITSQNHGYAICDQSFSNEKNTKYFIEYTSLFDRSIEGICRYDKLVRSVQFHPEANPGPKDASIFFDEIKKYLQQVTPDLIDPCSLKELPSYHQGMLDTKIKKVLLIGSGPIKIGQASEFDYSGTQALKSLKELGLDVVLLNSNPATIMTDKDMSYKTYIEPITKETIKNIIHKENVDAVLSTMGGQTALNMCIELEQENFLKDNGVKLLGANVDTIHKTEDRELFAKELSTLGYKSGKRFRAHSQTQAIELAKSSVNYPLIIRRDFALGGKGAALVHNEFELLEVFETSDIKFPITMEKSLLGWKEVELEVMVDCYKNGVVICSIENIDPCGIHTGDSITVAPAQTISDHCYQNLREMSLKIAKHMNVVAGGANVQFAINPNDEDDIVVIEMNPRVSRSSALASKATGYPIAKISAGLALGLNLFQIINDITKSSPVAFEPTLDYVAVKIPIFPFNKFPSSSEKLGPQMRSVGEVLALGSNFNEAFMKALRATEQGLEVPSITQLKTTPLCLDQEYLHQRLCGQRELSLVSVLDGLRQGISASKIQELSKISSWFIDQMNLFWSLEKELMDNDEIINKKQNLYEYKSNGFSDKYLALLTNRPQGDILDLRFKLDLHPVFKAVDTCSGEFMASTPYFYSTYSHNQDSQPLSQKHDSIAIFGSGPNRIGQGIEFDYSCVKSAQCLLEHNIKSILINSNPETVSTDYDSSDRLYLSPLYSEDLFDILRYENPMAVISSFSGQTGINIRGHLEESFRTKYYTPKFLGPSSQVLDLVEDRKQFDLLTKSVSLKRTKSLEVRGHKQLIDSITQLGFPVIIRPSYVIGGESMFIFKSHTDITQLPKHTLEGLENENVVFQVENYIENALEYDVDLIRDSKGNCIFTICEHIEHAGVHSGDSGMICPPIHLTKPLLASMEKIAKDMAEQLGVIGPINFQFALKNDDIYCIEANPRGSRTIPFLSKAYDINLPALATMALLGHEMKETISLESPYYVVKQSTFPFDRFVDDSIILGPKMRSTGETLGVDKNLQSAILKSYLGNYPRLDGPGKILISMADHSKEVLQDYLLKLDSKKYQLMATKGTHDFICSLGHKCTLVTKLNEKSTGDSISMLEAIKDDQLILVLNTPLTMGKSRSDGEYIRNMAIQYGAPCFTRIENIKAVLGCLSDELTSVLRPISLQEMNCE